MRVIEPAKIHGWSMQHVCNHCEAKLLIEEGDLFYTYKRSSDGLHNYICIRCCECKNLDYPINVPFDKVRIRQNEDY
jgi:hypothetical protein